MRSTVLVRLISAHSSKLFRIKTTVILTKLCFATGVLGIPQALVVVGYGPGIALLIAFGSSTTCRCHSVFSGLLMADKKAADFAYIMYQFRMRYPGVHNIADAAFIVGGPVYREIAGALFLLTWVQVALHQTSKPI